MREQFWHFRDLVEMEKDQLSKQNKQLTFDLEKARETIQTKNKDNLKVHSLKKYLILLYLRRVFPI